jgi:uncharacterized oligopeptide transporter (OPT) family protein
MCRSAAFFGAFALGVASAAQPLGANIVQTAGTAAAQTAFMCVLLAAFDMLAARPGTAFSIVLTPFQSFAWLTTAGILGVLLAVPMRRHFVVDEKLTYADGVAAAETLMALDGEGASDGVPRGARRPASLRPAHADDRGRAC